MQRSSGAAGSSPPRGTLRATSGTIALIFAGAVAVPELDRTYVAGHGQGAEVVDRGLPPAETLEALIHFHIDVLVSKPDLIVVQDRDLHNLTPAANHEVRSLQRRYVEQWVDVLLALMTERGVTLARQEARVRVHAMFGLLNSSPRLPALDSDRLRAVLTAMATAALESAQ